MGKITNLLVSVIIPSYNSAAYLAEALDSALRQAYSDIEIIVVDDGSTDNTKEVVGRYIKEYPDKVRYFFQENSGPGIARNAGIKAAKGRYIAFLDADDIWLSNKLSLQMKLFNESPSLEIVHTDFVYFYKDGAVRCSEYSDKVKRNFSGDIFFKLFRENFIRTSTVVVKKGGLDKIGAFDKNLFMSEDYDLWLRITKGRSVAGYVNKPLLRVRQHGAHITGDARKTYMWVNKVIKKTLESSPEIEKELKSHLPYRLAKNHSTVGYKLFCDKEFRTAREEFRQSLSYRIKTKTLFYYFFTLLDPKIIDGLRSIKKYLAKPTKNVSIS